MGDRHREMANNILGMHLMADGAVSDASVFEEGRLAKMLTDFVSALEMQLIYGPVFKHVELDPSKLTGDVFQDEGGTSVFCMISTSHLSVHVWPLRKQFMLDIFSCRDFDQAKAMEILSAYLNPSQLNTRLVRRSPL
jgi:S-adenosylmethionine decarboxylase